jgi:type II secretory ATPase GspE/PulE/Tfp pilus assembly ATPase PilB-like protein
LASSSATTARKPIVIFGFGKKNNSADDDDEEQEDIEYVTFQGALNGKDVDLSANARLAQAGLIPAKALVTDALGRRAEAVKLEIKGDRAQVTMYVDGIAYSGGKMPKPQAVAITQMMKLLAGLDVKLRGKLQHGGLKSELEGVPYEITVETSPAADGSERLALRTRNMKAKLTTPEELGLPASVKATLREISSRRHGLVLVAGPAGSGITTTMYAFLRGIDLYMYSAFSTVKMGSREVYNVQKFEANEGDEPLHTLERMIRSEADVIFVDPIKDAEAAKAVCAAANRTTIMGEIPAKDAASAIVQLCEWVGDKKLVSELIEGIYGQKLIRTLCNECREAFRPNPKLLAKVGLPPETKVLYRKPEPEPDPKTGELPEPCEKCGGSGYFGRAVILELITGSETVKKLIAEGATADQLKAQARAEGMLTLHKDGLRMVADGKTTLEELQRVFKAT